jgi:Tol biopolymer transport system component
VAGLVVAACGGSGTTTSTSTSVAPSQAAASVGASASPSAIPLPAPTVAGTIAFTRYAENEWTQVDYDVCVVNTDGTGLKVLAGGEGCQMYPRWSPDGSKIVYFESRTGDQDPQHVWVVNADGSGKVQLTAGASGEYRSDWPNWSQDGRQIAFSHTVFYTGGVGREAIYVMNADGSGVRNVTSEKGSGVSLTDYWPTWEKDGTISFYRNTGNGALSKFSVNPDGSGLTRLVKQAGVTEYEAEGKWLKYVLGLSPDGKWVARHEVETDRLVIVPVRGGGDPVVLLDPVAAYAQISVDAAWSPDGQALAIASQSETGFSRIYVVNADGSGLSAIPGITDAREPAWRPL